MRCRHCHRDLQQTKDGEWVDPHATGDDAIWREVCDSHDTFDARHEPDACERCGAHTENQPGHWVHELGTEEQLCLACFESRMLDKIADVLREPEWSPTTLDVVAMLVALTGRDLNTEES